MPPNISRVADTHLVSVGGGGVVVVNGVHRNGTQRGAGVRSCQVEYRTGKQ